jgi:hypothetical protein
MALLWWNLGQDATYVATNAAKTQEMGHICSIDTSSIDLICENSADLLLFVIKTVQAFLLLDL